MFQLLKVSKKSRLYASSITKISLKESIYRIKNKHTDILICIYVNIPKKHPTPSIVASCRSWTSSFAGESPSFLVLFSSVQLLSSLLALIWTNRPEGRDALLQINSRHHSEFKALLLLLEFPGARINSEQQLPAINARPRTLRKPQLQLLTSVLWEVAVFFLHRGIF